MPMEKQPNYYIIITAILVILAIGFFLNLNVPPVMEHQVKPPVLPPHVKRGIFVLIILLLGVAGWLIYTQVKRNDYMHEMNADTGKKTILGKIISVTSNKLADADGFYVSDRNGDTITLKFSPHIAARVLTVAGKGDEIEAIAEKYFYPDPKDNRKDVFWLVQLKNLTNGYQINVPETLLKVSHGA